MRSINWDKKNEIRQQIQKNTDPESFRFFFLILATAYPYTALRVNTKQFRTIWTVFADSLLKNEGTGIELTPPPKKIAPKIKITPARTFPDFKKNIHAYPYTACRVYKMQVRAIWTAFLNSTLKNKGTGAKLNKKNWNRTKNKDNDRPVFSDWKTNPRVPLYRA